MTPGTHGSTFGESISHGSCKYFNGYCFKLKVFEKCEKPIKIFNSKLNQIKDNHPNIIKEIRGKGLWNAVI